MSLLPRLKKGFEQKISSFLSPIHVEQIVKKPMLLSFQPRVNIDGSFLWTFSIKTRKVKI